ncbi:hypothetical protein J4211_00450 [Candidatus Woesearchaeota archaeon]|nr:hypothetical protein [Candidatus Woesearchaeota archaeon]
MNFIDDAFASLDKKDVERARKVIACRVSLGGKDYQNHVVLALCSFIDYANTANQDFLNDTINHAEQAVPNVGEDLCSFYTHFVLARAYTFLGVEPDKRKTHYIRASEIAEKSGLALEADWIKTLEAEDAQR